MPLINEGIFTNVFWCYQFDLNTSHVDSERTFFFLSRVLPPPVTKIRVEEAEAELSKAGL